MEVNDWPIHEIAALAGVTSRTLRHYDSVGLLAPSRTAANGYRHYDRAALVRLQRILLLRELGLGLPAIAAILDHQESAAAALATHVSWLRAEQARLAGQIASVEKTIAALNEGGAIMAETMFDGFDHTHYKDEVEQRWGKDAYARSDSWWRGLDAAGQAAWKGRVAALNRDWIAAFDSGAPADSAAAQELARRHVEWLRAVPGTPASEPGADVRGYVAGLGEMYVDDPRFGANNGGAAGAAFVRDALALYAEHHL
ncbi:MerR family transcriptional regulator [Arthrobacter sp. SDTb3-6]|uniref:MerR family transcriptional regulator n=1 Tax=Arthrobacter sp. SDTb3-6 TaxID=2713571 RepID=UPI00159D6AE3|nr:MerR family transcriptional regulator [Arthrobacter sp. SDTb3-6]NVM98730.1 MerR family transcriptional regulator [Arthrobacter sp. SDTb3-6]